jgi:hypothetical protein
VIGSDTDRDAVAAGECDIFEPLPTSDLLGLSALAFRMRVDSITTTGSDPKALTVARLAPLLGLPFHLEQAAST